MAVTLSESVCPISLVHDAGVVDFKNKEAFKEFMRILIMETHEHVSDDRAESIWKRMWVYDAHMKRVQLNFDD
jgi:hypothetical protein